MTKAAVRRRSLGAFDEWMGQRRYRRRAAKVRPPWVWVKSVAIPQSRPAEEIRQRVDRPASVATAASAASVLNQWWVGTMATS